MGKIIINLYGSFRRYGNGRHLEVSVEKNMAVSGLRKLMGQRLQEVSPGFKDLGLLQDSVFANGTRVLKESDEVKIGEELAILPPVCGG